LHILLKVKQREGIADAALRLDRISDGKKACGFAWTWTCKGMEGLRGTTFVEFNDLGKIGKYWKDLRAINLSASTFCCSQLTAIHAWLQRFVVY
jgi:hypothetical protein